MYFYIKSPVSLIIHMLTNNENRFIGNGNYDMNLEASVSIRAISHCYVSKNKKLFV